MSFVGPELASQPIADALPAGTLFVLPLNLDALGASGTIASHGRVVLERTAHTGAVDVRLSMDLVERSCGRDACLTEKGVPPLT